MEAGLRMIKQRLYRFAWELDSWRETLADRDGVSLGEVKAYKFKCNLPNG